MKALNAILRRADRVVRPVPGDVAAAGDDQEGLDVGVGRVGGYSFDVVLFADEGGG